MSTSWDVSHDIVSIKIEINFYSVYWQSNNCFFDNLSVSVCKNQEKWEKSETCMSKPHRSDNVKPLKDTFSI